MVRSFGSNNYLWQKLRDRLENNYIPLGYHGSILWIQQLLLLFVVLRSKTKVVNQKKHNHGFPRENNYIPLGYHGSILWIQQLLDPEDPTMVRSFGSNNYLWQKRRKGIQGYHGSILWIQQLFDPEDPTMVRQSIIAILSIFLL